MLPATKGNRTSLLVPAVTGFVSFALAFGWMLTHNEPYTLRLDNRLVMYPLTLAAWRAWVAGQVPVWTDGIWSGFPLLAEPQTGALYVPHAIAFALTPSPHWRAFDLATALHAGLFGAGMTCFLRSLGARPVAAVFGTALATFSPELAGWARGFLPCFVALAWWPWGLLAAERLARGARPEPWLVLGAFAIAAGFLGGYPEFAIHGAAIDGLWLILRTGGQPIRRRVLRLVALATGAALLAAPQVLPTASELSDTTRAARPYLADVLAAGLGGYGPLVDPWNAGAGFLGVALPLLALLSLGVAAGRMLWGLAILAFLLALGPVTPLHGWLSAVPPFSLFRNPYKFAVVTQLLLAAAAGLGAECILAAWPARRTLTAAGFVLAVLAATERVVATSLPDRAIVGGSHDPSLRALLDTIDDGIVPGLRTTKPGQPADRLLVMSLPTLLGGLPLIRDVEQASGSSVSIVSHRSLESMDSVHDLDSLSLLGVGALFEPELPCRPRPGWVPILESSHGCLSLSGKAPSRYQIVERAVTVGSVPALEMALRAPPDGKTVPVLAPDGTVPIKGYGTVTVREHAAGRASLTTFTTTPSLVLVRETWKPGWEAYVDGAPAPVLRAAGVFFVVPVGAGLHTIDLRFHQPGLLPGVAAAALGLALAAAALLRRRARPTKRAPELRCEEI